MIYFWADTHLDHTNIIKFCNRPFWYDDGGNEKPDVQAMNAATVQTWNDTVRPNDTIYHLGDFSFSKDANKNQKLFDSLNGKKILIKGNHDYGPILKLGWDSVHDYLEIKYNKTQFMLFHYPIASWKNKSHGSIHLFGHVHGKPQPIKGRCLDVGYDNGFSKPISIDEVLDRMKNIPIFDNFA